MELVHKNQAALEQAGLVPAGYQFSSEASQILESLTDDEVQQLISIGNKLGRDFLLEYGGGETVGILF
ncbi:MAG TPA: hypothetical protein VKE51_29145 [Vicinamibacterales bacterium]|nr:hypothetical protein [Vicinamibacterales bacterium]